jgi:hypothetical protein
LCPDSIKDGFCECEYALHKKYKILDNKRRKWIYRICWNLNVEFNSMRWTAKPEKVSMTLKQWHNGNEKMSSWNPIVDDIKN